MAGPITTLTASMSLQLLTEQAYTIDTVAGAQGAIGQPSVHRSIGFLNVSSPQAGMIKATQVKFLTETIGASGTLSLDLAAASANVVGNSAATFAKVAGFIFWLPATTEVPNLSLSVQASSVTIGNNGGGSNQNKLCLNANADGIVLATGDAFAFLKSNSLITVDGTHKIVLITNNDGTNAATLLIGLIGTDT